MLIHNLINSFVLGRLCHFPHTSERWWCTHLSIIWALWWFRQKDHKFHWQQKNFELRLFITVAATQGLVISQVYSLFDTDNRDQIILQKPPDCLWRDNFINPVSPLLLPHGLEHWSNHFLRRHPEVWSGHECSSRVYSREGCALLPQDFLGHIDKVFIY